MRTELAAVVAGRDQGEALARDGRLQTGPHGGLNAIRGKAVDHDLVDGPRSVGQVARREWSDRRAIGVVRARLELLVAGSHLASAADDAPRKGEDHVGDCADRGDGRLGGPERSGLSSAAKE